MKNYNQLVKINHNRNWPYIPDHHYRNLVMYGPGSCETNMLLNLVTNQPPDIAKIYMYAKYQFESKYYLSINGREEVQIKKLKKSKSID